jgi:hypothetical protein
MTASGNMTSSFFHMAWLSVLASVIIHAAQL